MAYKLLALDLDGTLTNSQKKISDRNRDVLQKAIAQGVHIVLASGRPLIGIERVAKELGLYEKGGRLLSRRFFQWNITMKFANAEGCLT